MEPDLPAIESLYDILYADRQRIATYMAQLDPNGTLTGIKTTGSQSTNLKAEGKLSGIVVGGSLEGTDTATQGMERQFDPVWAIPITMLDRLDELSFIHRDLMTTPIGSLFLIKGWPRIIDIRMLRDMWPAVGKMLELQIAATVQPSENRKQRRQSQRLDAPKSGASKPIDALVEVVKHLPHAIEMHMVSMSGIIWCTLDPSCMLTSAEDVGLKHGTVLPGEWYLLGVLDALPNMNDVPAWNDLPASQLATMMINLLSAIRAEWGRPKEYFGITPLMMFRTIGQRGLAADVDEATSDVVT